jgi:Arc/MetJ-type ribon-helix-helix transcriptional regulator
MAMNVRFTETETEQLRAQANAERRSMGDVTRAAVREYIARRSQHDTISEAINVVLAEDAGLLRRLGQA